MNPELPETSIGTPRTREAFAHSLSLKSSAEDIQNQLKEDPSGVKESDPPIVVRDGRTDHTPPPKLWRAGMAKEWAVIQSSQSTDTKGRNAPIKSISSTLTALNRKAVAEPEHRFRSVYRLIDKQMLYDSYYRLKKGASPGVDGVTFAQYGSKLDENLESLLSRLKEKRYRAQSVKRRYIEKGGGKLRPLGLPSLEDKIVQMCAARILESIYEADFSDRSVAYRRNQPGAREVSQILREELMSGTYRWIVEADIKSFFDDVDHAWLLRMLEERIDDRAFVGLIGKWLKAGILEPDETEAWDPTSGTPQGGIISPILANIYLHYVLDLWIEKRISKESRAEVMFIRYADDIIVGFAHKRDADAYLSQLPGRLGKFSLRLAEEKSSLVKFNRWEPDVSGKFTFLGFDFYWGRTRKNKNQTVVRRKTNKKKFRESLLRMKKWIYESRSWPLRMILSSLRRRLRGYWNYYGVIGNSIMNRKYNSAVRKLVYKWLNRRSQRRSYNWAQFAKLWDAEWQIPGPSIVEKPWSRESQRELNLAGSPK